MTKKKSEERMSCWIPAAVLVASFTVELVGREDSEDSLLRAEVLPLNPRVGLEVVCQHCRRKKTQKEQRKLKINGQDILEISFWLDIK